MNLKGKKILIGITGGIAAYKIAYLVRLLKKKEAEVRCMMTPASSAFITPLTLSTLSENPVGIDLFDSKTGEWTNHVEWGMWADLVLIAPATANSLAKMANGFSDNFLLTTYLSAKCPVFIAPAMDLDMYQHPSTKENLLKLEAFGNVIIPAENGSLASGLSGEGRMAEPENILLRIESFFNQDQRFKNKKVLITAGPTYEAIDPVRFIGNHSSGKMGFALAEAAAQKGSKVILISGPSKLNVSHPNIELISVQSAEEMLEKSLQYWISCDLGIFAAAVADYKPNVVATQKIKKSENEMQIHLVKNPDILANCSSLKKENQRIVGFALETQDGMNYAQDKLKRKNLDAIVLNQMGEPGVGFATDTNKVTLIDANNKITTFELKHKTDLAFDLLDKLIEL